MNDAVRRNGSMAWIRYLVALIVTIVVLIALPALANHIIANDKESRARDEKLDEKCQDRYETTTAKLAEQTAIVTEIRTDMKWVRKALESR